MLCSLYEYENFLFVMRSCSNLLFVNYILPKSFVLETILNFFRVHVALQKMFIFSIRPAKKSSCSCCFAKPKIFVFVFVKTGNSRIFVFVFSKKCAQTKKSSCSWFSAYEKSSQKGRNLRVGIFLYRQNYEGKTL